MARFCNLRMLSLHGLDIDRTNNFADGLRCVRATLRTLEICGISVTQTLELETILDAVPLLRRLRLLRHRVVGGGSGVAALIDESLAALGERAEKISF